MISLTFVIRGNDTEYIMECHSKRNIFGEDILSMSVSVIVDRLIK